MLVPIPGLLIHWKLTPQMMNLKRQNFSDVKEKKTLISYFHSNK